MTDYVLYPALDVREGVAVSRPLACNRAQRAVVEHDVGGDVLLACKARAQSAQGFEHPDVRCGQVWDVRVPGGAAA